MPRIPGSAPASARTPTRSRSARSRCRCSTPRRCERYIEPRAAAASRRTRSSRPTGCARSSTTSAPARSRSTARSSTSTSAASRCPCSTPRGRAVAALGHLDVRALLRARARDRSRRCCATSRARPRRCSAPPRFQRSRKTPSVLERTPLPGVRSARIASATRSDRRGSLSMSRASITKAHTKIQELSWDPTFVEPVDKYPTDYTFEKAPKKDPLKQVLRSYFPMEEEKDNRVFGAMDGAIRGNMFRQVQERWMEWQKLFLSIIPFPEISAARAMPLAINAVPEPRGPQRPGHPDDRRGPPLDDPDEPQAAVHEPLHRPGRVRHHREGVLQLLRRHDRPPVRRGLHHRRRDHRRQRLPDDRRRDGVHERPVRRDARRGRRQRRLPAADGLPLGAVRRVAPHLQRLLDHPHGARRRAQPRSCSSATCATPGGTTTASSTPPSARSSSTARRTAARTATATRSRGGAGSTTTTTAATSCRWRSTA